MTKAEERALLIEVKALRREVAELRARQAPGYMAQMQAGSDRAYLSDNFGRTWAGHSITGRLT